MLRAGATKQGQWYLELQMQDYMCMRVKMPGSNEVAIAVADVIQVKVQGLG